MHVDHLDRSDADHATCRNLLAATRATLVVPAPVFVKVKYWTHRRLSVGAFAVEDLTMADYRRIRERCDRYADADIGFVDAAVLAITERLGEPKLATLDRRHFGKLRPRTEPSTIDTRNREPPPKTQGAGSPNPNNMNVLTGSNTAS